MPGRARPPRAKAPALKIGSHNTCSLVKHTTQAARFWRMLGYQVVLVQETRAHTATPTAAATFTKLKTQLQDEGWTTFWSNDTSARAGVCIAIDTTLLGSGALTLSGAPIEVPGRALKLQAKWAGHDFDLVCAYVPATTNEQIPFLEHHLLPILAPDRRSIVGGDFNFVHAPHLDRLSQRRAQSSAPDPAAARWAQRLPHMVDTYRARYPRRRDYSFYHTNKSGASRIDRLYADSALAPYITSGSVCSRPGPSDHAPVSLTLLGRVGSPVGPGCPRVRTGFFGVPELDALFLSQATSLAHEAPADHHALVAWYPSFARSITVLGSRLHAASRARSLESLASATADLDRLREDLDTVSDAAAMAAVLEARRRWREAYDAAHSAELLAARRHHIHHGERPSPGLTATLRRPAGTYSIPGLRARSGRTVAGSAAAEVAAAHYASISAQPAVVLAAQAEVLAALAEGPVLDAELAAALGSQTVSTDEVLAALKRLPTGKSPGLDGIPVEVYRRYSQVFAPLLARLFTAVSSTGQSPRGFLDGLICLIHKGGDRSVTANYRPITLLNTSYRIMAKVMADRLNPCLAEIIGREQTAYIRGRHISDTIMLLQCLPRLLQLTGREGALAVFCDFAKAYDTIDRNFLFATMHMLGLGQGFINTARALLPAETLSRAKVNNFISNPVAFLAGVRQGCPLAPLLYLCIGEALLRFLRHRGLGVDVDGHRFIAGQYADDTSAFLSSSADLAPFRGAMSTFAQATGQVLNPFKTKVLPIGLHTHALPAAFEGLAVVPHASTLGVCFTAYSGDPLPQWTAQLERVKGAYTSLVRKPLTTFGRANASGTYGIAKVLHHAEFSGAPDAAALKDLERITTKMVDRGQAPADQRRKAAKLKHELLVGRPRSGGFGAFPWKQHIQARHAVLALRIITGTAATPWISVARRILVECGYPVLAPLWDKSTPAAAVVPGHLGRCLGALQALPAPTLLGPVPVPGPWCAAAPLWGCLPHYVVAGLTLEQQLAYTNIASLRSTLRTVGLSMLAFHTFHATPPARFLPDIYARFLCNLSLPPRSLQTDLLYPGLAYATLGVILHAVPTSWKWHACSAPPSEDEALQEMVAPYGWGGAGTPAPTTPLTLTVRAATKLLLTDATASKTASMAAYAALALELPLEHSDALAAQVQNMLARIWRLPWDNKRKEPLWRLVHDGLPTSEKLSSSHPRPGARPPQPCSCCGAPRPGRAHHFWSCPAAQALVGCLSTHAGQQLTRAHLWLARPPPSIHQGVWDAVCVAAVSALDSARRRGYALAHPTGPPATPSLNHILSTTSRHAILLFWELLADFSTISTLPPSWASVGPEHLFLRSVDRCTLQTAPPPMLR